MNNLRFVGLSAIRRYTMLLLLWAMAAMAWAQDCSFSISHTMTPGVCTADGAITINVTNTTAPSTIEYQYLLYNLTAGGDPTPARTSARSYTFSDLAPANYRVEVIALCTNGGGNPHQIIDNIAVTTTHVPVEGGFDEYHSRPSYPCGTGRISLGLTGGRGAYTIRVISGPSHVGEVVSYVKEYDHWRNKDVYRLVHEDFRAGRYKLAVTDECNYTYEFFMELDAVDELLKPDIRSRKLPVELGMCDRFNVNISLYTGDPSLSHGLVKHVMSSNPIFFEIGMLFPGMNESDIVWQDYRPNEYGDDYIVNFDDYSAYAETLSNGRKKINVKIITRLKPCPDQRIVQEVPLIVTPSIFVSFSMPSEIHCDNNVLYAEVSGDYCPPVTYEAYALVNSNVIPLSVSSRGLIDPTPVNNIKDARIYVKVADSRGYKAEANTTFSSSIRTWVENRRYGYNRKTCTQGLVSYSIYIESGVTLENYGVVPMVCDREYRLYKGDRELIATQQSSSERVIFEGLVPNVNYTVEWEENGVTKQRFFHEVPGTSPVAPEVLSIGFVPSTSQINVGRLAVKYGGSIGENSWITVTGPEGEIERYNLPYGNEYEEYPIEYSWGTYPPGRYTVTLYNSCSGKTKTAVVDHKAFYLVPEFTYDLTHECGLAYLSPRAKVSLNGKDLSPTQFCFIVFPKANHVQPIVVRNGERIRISAPGDYVLALVVGSSVSTGYYYLSQREHLPDNSDQILARLSVPYIIPPVNIDPDRTLAYVCGTNAVGHIYMQATGGTKPYTYTIYTDPERTQLAHFSNGNPVMATDDDVYFNFGEMGRTYYAKIVDKCGSSYNYDVPMINVSDLKLAYALPNNVCTNDPIQLRLAGPPTLKAQMTVTWKNPKKNTIGNTPDVDLPQATTAMSGNYTVEFVLPGCGTRVTNTIPVQVADPESATNPTKLRYDLCVGQRAVIQGATSSASKPVRWQIASIQTFDPDYLTGLSEEPYLYEWTTHPLLDAVNTSTYNAAFYKPGTYILRNVIMGVCNFNSKPILVKVKHCTVPLNQHLMHRPIINWETLSLPATQAVE